MLSVLRVRSAALALLLLAGCSRTPERPTDLAKSPPAEGGSFQLARVDSQKLERAITVTGSLLPLDQTPVSVKVPGRIATIAVDMGSRVLEGDLIARVDEADYALRVKQAEGALNQARARVGLPLDSDDDRVEVETSSAVKRARAVLDEAKANRERIGALSQQGILSTSELETASATYQVALSRYEEALEEARNLVAQLQQRRAEFQIAQRQQADTYILAPFDGAVQERRASIGEYMAVGSPVVVFVRNDPLRLRVEVAEREAVRVRIGQPVRVTVEGDTNTYVGEVKRLSPAIVQGSRTLVVEADVASRGRLRPGSFARGQIITVADAPALTVPAGAVVSFAGIEKVFAVEDGLAVEKRVSTGDRGPGWVEVTAGLKAGETVVLAPGSLQTGQRVTGLPEATTGKPAIATPGS